MRKKTTGTVAAKPKPASGTKARAKAKGKRPVLTSPWKLGILVSLLLVLVGIGVGAYFAVLHRIEFPWLVIARSGIRFDSFGFFRQMYPLAAGLVAIALVSYFLIASSVRRYKYYLDSGQDYRKMISLAESIDDLTSPAQIARLSSYPELQTVLRSYGDQIREISQDISRGGESPGYGDLETDVEALLGGADAEGSALEAKPYAAVLRRISDLRSCHRAQIDELEKRDEADRQTLAAAALAVGRIMETAGGASEEIVEIMKSVGELAHAARGIAPGAVAPREAARGDAPGSAEKAGGFESSARKLEEGGRVLQELSEENNGIAIGLALMAARGSIEQHDLATFAERVRVTAERFQKLSGSVAGIARELLDARYEMKGSRGATAPEAPAPAAQARLMETIQKIAAAIEERGERLQGRMSALASELHEVRRLLGGETEYAAAAPARSDMAERSGGVEAPAEAAELRIDRGSSWSGMAEVEDAAADEGDTESIAPAETESGESPRDVDARPEETPAAQAGDFSDMSSLRNLDGPAAAPEGQRVPGGREGGWMEMPGHSWRPVTVEEAGTGAVDETEEVPVAVRTSDEAVRPADSTDEDDEPIYDLTELGAVEYVEETQPQR